MGISLIDTNSQPHYSSNINALSITKLTARTIKLVTTINNFETVFKQCLNRLKYVLIILKSFLCGGVNPPNMFRCFCFNVLSR